MLETNRMLFLAQGVAKSFATKEGHAFLSEHLSDKAEIILHVNGKEFKRDKALYIQKLKEAFSENIQKVDLLDTSFTVKGPSTVEMTEKSVQRRKGSGLNESGDGLYHVDSVGQISFVQEGSELKISRMEFTYTKTRVIS